MQSWVALLRGINVGGHRRVAMADLQAVVEETGAEEVQTYLQSGNVVFRSGDRPGALIEDLERRVAERLDLDVCVLLRAGRELAAIVGNPLAAKRDPTTLHVTFLAAKPDPARVRDLDPLAGAPDEFQVVGSEVFLFCSDGYGRSRLTNAFFEKRLGCPATTRNWRTATALAELAR